MIESYNTHRTIFRRQLGTLDGKKLNFSSIRFGDGNYLSKFSSATSIHGIIYLGEPKRPFLERIFWIFVMLLVFLLCGYQIRQLFKNWTEHHITTILDEGYNYITLRDVPFPAVTICSDLQLQNIDNIEIKNQSLFKEFGDSINLLCSSYAPDLNVSLNYINPKTWIKLIQNHKISCKQRVISISWIREKVDIPCQYFQPIYTNYGVCYSFNMIPFHRLLNKGYNEELSNMNHFKSDIITKADEIMWNAETGYSKNAKRYHMPWKIVDDSYANSVKIIFSLEKTKSGKFCPTTDTGMTLFLHSPTDVPTGVQPIAYITSNTIVYISTTITSKSTSSSLSNWEPKIRNCYFQHERTLKFFNIYTNNNCNLECRANNTLKMCGCVAYYHPRDKNTPICGSASYRCMKQYSNNGYSIFNENLVDLNTTDDCNCLEDCSEIEYIHQVVDTNKQLSQNSTNYDNQFVSIVVMHYKRKEIFTIQKTALIPVNELLGNIGGSLGLFLGASIISVFEIIYFFLVRSYVDQWNKKKLKKKIIPNI